MAHYIQSIKELDECFVKSAGNVIKYHDDEKERTKVLKSLRKVLITNCIEIARIKAADDIKQQLQLVSEHEPQEKVEELTRKYKEAISQIQIDPSKDNRLLEYDRQIVDLLQANEILSSNGANDIDVDLQLTGSEINMIDPITKTRMTDPIRNIVCGHVYDKNSLVAMLEKNKHTRCPVVGCTSIDYIDLNQCRTDIVMKTYLERNPI